MTAPDRLRPGMRVTSDLRALTVRQPYAWAIASGHKRVENRSRPVGYRGPLAIHAGLRIDGADVAKVRAIIGHPAADSALSSLTTGAIVAVAWLSDCHPAAGCCGPWGTDAYNNKRAHHLVLTDVEALPGPVPCRGALGLWRVPVDVAERVEAARTVTS